TTPTPHVSRRGTGRDGLWLPAGERREGGSFHVPEEALPNPLRDGPGDNHVGRRREELPHRQLRGIHRGRHATLLPSQQAHVLPAPAQPVR
ncbi:unnamed protein product, partial [Ectocarpus sp. 6 AP-2014]